MIAVSFAEQLLNDHSCVRLVTNVPAHFDAPQSLAPKVFEPRRCQLGIAHRVLDILVAEVGLQGARVVPIVREFITAGMPQHMRMRLEAQLRQSPGALDHSSEPGGAKRRAALGREYEWRLMLLLALEPSQGAQFVA